MAKKASVGVACAIIRDAGKDWERSLPFLTWSLSLGLTIWFGALFTMGACSWAYSEGFISAKLLVLCNALAAAVLHELEHDLIHSLWAKDWPGLQDVMLAGIWVAKLGASPWFRRKLHLKHHALSGREDDAEERLIGLGMPLGLRRMAVTCHPMGEFVCVMCIMLPV